MFRELNLNIPWKTRRPFLFYKVINNFVLVDISLIFEFNNYKHV